MLRCSSDGSGVPAKPNRQQPPFFTQYVAFWMRGCKRSAFASVRLHVNVAGTAAAPRFLAMNAIAASQGRPASDQRLVPPVPPVAGLPDYPSAH